MLLSWPPHLALVCTCLHVVHGLEAFVAKNNNEVMKRGRKEEERGWRKEEEGEGEGRLKGRGRGVVGGSED